MAKINDIRFLARETAKEVSGSPRDWMGVSGHGFQTLPLSVLRYSFDPRPASGRNGLCGAGSVNEKMRRWVNRGAKGIALIDDTGPRRACVCI